MDSQNHQHDAEKNAATKHDQEPAPRRMSTVTWFLLSGSILLGVMQAALDSTITANLQPVILSALGEVAKFPWVNATYSLGMGASCLLWGQLYNLFDKKKIFIVARLTFAVGSAVSGSAPTMDAFIVGKVVTGAGGSGTYIGSIAILTSLVSAHKFSVYYSYIGCFWGFGTILGPIIASELNASHGGWRWSFYLDVILTAASLPAVFFSLPSQRGSSTSLATRRAYLYHMDLVGCALSAGAVATSVAALSLPGSLYDWKNGWVIGLFVTAGTLWILFCLQQVYAIFTSEKARVVPIHILKSVEMGILLFQVFCPIGILFVVVYYAPLYFQLVRGETVLQSAIHILPFLIAVVVFMLISGRLIIILDHYKLWFIAGGIFTLTGSVGLYLVDLNTPIGAVFTYLVLVGVGVGSWIMNAGPVMAAKVHDEHVKDTGTIFGFVDTASGALLTAVADCLFINRVTDTLQAVLVDTSRQSVQRALIGVDTELISGLSDSQQEKALQAVLDSMKNVWILAMSTTSVALVLAMGGLRWERLRHVARK